MMGTAPAVLMLSWKTMGALEEGHEEVREMGDGLGTLNTEEMNGPRSGQRQGENGR